MAATDTVNDPRTLDPVKVQHILDNLHGNPLSQSDSDAYRRFKVIFLTKTGEQRMYEGTLFDSHVRKDDIPFKETSGKVKSFNINRVLYLGVL